MGNSSTVDFRGKGEKLHAAVEAWVVDGPKEGLDGGGNTIAVNPT